MFGQAIHLPENRTPLLVPARPAPRGRCVCHVAFRLLLRCVTEVHIHLALSNRTRHKLSFHSIWNCSRSTGTSPPQPRSPLSFAAARISAGGPSFVPVFVNAASNPHAPSASICAAPRASEHGARCIMATAKLAPPSQLQSLMRLSPSPSSSASSHSDDRDQGIAEGGCGGERERKVSGIVAYFPDTIS